MSGSVAATVVHRGVCVCVSVCVLLCVCIRVRGRSVALAFVPCCNGMPCRPSYALFLLVFGRRGPATWLITLRWAPHHPAHWASHHPAHWATHHLTYNVVCRLPSKVSKIGSRLCKVVLSCYSIITKAVQLHRQAILHRNHGAVDDPYRQILIARP